MVGGGGALKLLSVMEPGLIKPSHVIITTCSGSNVIHKLKHEGHSISGHILEGPCNYKMN